MFVPQMLLSWGGGSNNLTFVLGHGGKRGRGALLRSVQYTYGFFDAINITLAQAKASGQWAMSGERAAKGCGGGRPGRRNGGQRVPSRRTSGRPVNAVRLGQLRGEG